MRSELENLEIAAELCGWTEETQLELLLRYIENQQDRATFADFIVTIAEEELGVDDADTKV